MNRAQEILFLLGEKVKGFDSPYLQRAMVGLAKDISYEDKEMAKLLKDLAVRIDQTNPDGDVTQKDIWKSISGVWIEKKYKRDKIQQTLDDLWDSIS